MIVSLNWLKKFTPINCSPEELANLIGSRLVEIEEVIDLGKRYEGIFVAEIRQADVHPNADKLNVYLVDDAGVARDVERRDDGLVQVVSGDRTLKVGDKVAWLTPGSTVPSTWGEAEPFVLGSREMRGEMSHGMFGSGKELDVNADGEHVAVLDTPAPVGTSFSEAYELNDILLDIANKSLTHRPDCFGLVGFAREVAAIQGLQFTTPEWLMALDPVLRDPIGTEGVQNVHVEIEDANMCPRYQAAVITNVDVSQQSPLMIQSYLKRLGVRPINAVVDVTNYLMLVTGHPLHAFDYEKVVETLGGGEPIIRVRGGREGDSLTLLDGRTVQPVADDILICAGDTPIALAGAMGGKDTEVSDGTRHIILESATFNLFNLRTTSMRHGIFSEAATRFTKGQAAAQTAPVLASAVRMMCDIAGGALATDVTDAYPGTTDPIVVTTSVAFVNELLGSYFAEAEVADTLRHVNCDVEVHDGDIRVTVPYWRQDLRIAEDIAEEVGRINGFDTIQPLLPLRPYRAVLPNEMFELQRYVRNRLVRLGANEVLTYSFVPERLLRSAHQQLDSAFRIVNALSPNLQFYRLSLTPSLLEKATQNSKAMVGDFMIFEMNKVHSRASLQDDGLPQEKTMIAGVFSSAKRTEKINGAAYFAAKNYLDELLASLGIAGEFEPLGEKTEHLQQPYDAARSAKVTVGGRLLGVIGEIDSATTESLKVPTYTAGFELDLSEVQALANVKPAYTPLPRFQGTTYDICFKTTAGVAYDRIYQAVTEALQATPLTWSVSPLDRYQRDDDALQTTLRLELTDPNGTITQETIRSTIDAVIQKTAQATGAEVI